MISKLSDKLTGCENPKMPYPGSQKRRLKTLNGIKRKLQEDEKGLRSKAEKIQPKQNSPTEGIRLMTKTIKL